MAYLEVQVKTEAGGTMAIAANGVSLAEGTGCSEWLFGSMYPSATDYFTALQNEGWTLVSNQSSSVVGMFYGLPFANNSGNYFFQGSGRYEIEWKEGKWEFKGSRDYFEEQDRGNDEGW